MVSCRQRGLSLLEVVIVVSLISVLMALSLPMLSHANAEARAVVCRQNLAEIGSAVSGYMRDYGQLPSLVELPPHQPGLSLPEMIGARLQTPSIAYCPSDETDRSQLLGTSYLWTAAYNGLDLSTLDRALDQPLITDREAFHQGTELAANELVLQRHEGKYQFIVTGNDQTEQTEIANEAEPDAGETQNTINPNAASPGQSNKPKPKSTKPENGKPDKEKPEKSKPENQSKSQSSKGKASNQG